MPHCYGDMREVTILVFFLRQFDFNSARHDNFRSYIYIKTNKNKQKQTQNRQNKTKTKTKNKTCLLFFIKLFIIYCFVLSVFFSLFLSLSCIYLDGFLFTNFNYQFVYLSILSFVQINLFTMFTSSIYLFVYLSIFNVFFYLFIYLSIY